MKNYKYFFHQYSEFHVFTRQSSVENCYRRTNYNIITLTHYTALFTCKRASSIYIYIYIYIYEKLNALASPRGFFRVNVSNLQFVWNQTNLASFTTLSVTFLLFECFLLRSSVYPLVKSRCSKSLNNLSPTIFKTWFSFSSDQRNSETWNL